MSHLLPSSFTLVTPNVLRVGSKETIVVEAPGATAPLEVKVRLWDFPQKTALLDEATARLGPKNQGLALVTVKSLPKDFKGKQHVYVQAEFPDAPLEQVLLLSFNSGYIFTQTDKTLYAPGNTGTGPPGRPPSGNPDGIVMEKFHMISMNHSGIIPGNYKLPDITNLGTWKIVSAFQHTPQKSFTAEFEVKEYGTSSSPVPGRTCITLPHALLCPVLRFLYGKPVEGQAFVLFGLMKKEEKKSLPRVSEVSYPKLVRDISALPSHFSCLLPTQLSVSDPDGSPAAGVPVSTDAPWALSGVTQADGTLELVINTPVHDSSLELRVRTTTPHIPAHRQVLAFWKVLAYQPQDSSKNYLHLSVPRGQAQPGKPLNVNFHLQSNSADVQRSVDYFIYLVVNKGRIVKAGRQPRLVGQGLVSLVLPITPTLIPSFRLVAYYRVPGTGEIVADSLWVDLADTCMGTLRVTEATPGAGRVHLPGEHSKIKVQGDPGASVGLVVVDKALYILSKKKPLSQAKIWDAVEKSDLGCGWGGGANSRSVFAEAGLGLQTHSGTELRRDHLPISLPETHCSPTGHRRRRRSPLLSQEKAEYQDQQLRRCCEDGMQENSMGYSCARRSHYILEGQACVTAFLACCHHIFGGVLLPKKTLLSSKEEFLQYDNIISRSQFPESWLWQMETLPLEVDREGLASKMVDLYLKDSITTWEVLAVSLAQERGLCVAAPYDITVMKDVFIDLRLPYSVVRNEQVAVRAVLYNHASQDIRVRVELMHNPKLCSASSPTRPFQQEVMVPAGKSHAINYVLIPIELGEAEVEVKAALRGFPMDDGVRKLLRVVVSEGKGKSEAGKDGEKDKLGMGAGQQLERVEPLDLSDVVPNTEPVTFISIKGDPLADTVENSIDGANLQHLIRVPSGCGEQNMIGMTPSVIATHYLDATGQWDRIGVERRSEAIRLIKQGYTQQMVYRKADDSYAAFTNRPASTWLTAYVVKVFASASSLVPVNPEVLCGAVKWLILEKQKPDGKFQEDAPVIHGEMVVQSLREPSPPGGGGPGDTLPQAQLADQWWVPRDGLSRLLFAGGTHWPDPQSHLYTLEATAYALLALLKMGRWELATPIAQWLVEQQYYGGGYGSTQATITVFQALAQYQLTTPPAQDTTLDITLNLLGRSHTTHWRIHSDDSMLARTEQVGSSKVPGPAPLQVMTVYYQPLSDATAQCKNFDLRVSVRNAPESGTATPRLSDVGPYPISLCGSWPLPSFHPGCRYLGAAAATMTILDVSMLTGFSPDTGDLEKLSNQVDRYISQFELDTALSERGSLIIYLDKVSRTEEECLMFKAHQHFQVGLIQPASVTIYEYYAPENRCTRFYHPTKAGGLLSTFCQDATCRCMEEHCTLMKKFEGHVTVTERVEAACEGGMDYGMTQTLSLEPSNPLGRGWGGKVSGAGLQGKSRRFVSPIACQESLGLVMHQTYLIWGHGRDLWNLKPEMAYLLGSNTWIEWWPHPDECGAGGRATMAQTGKPEPNPSARCSDLQAFALHMQTRGCPN
uniref:Anaphylatoxin-like domain-containing protein n=1 Tax=Ornithorhynchus anatinus TaxID=9258 RepID=F6WUR8_ORNAN